MTLSRCVAIKFTTLYACKQRKSFVLFFSFIFFINAIEKESINTSKKREKKRENCEYFHTYNN